MFSVARILGPRRETGRGLFQSGCGRTSPNESSAANRATGADRIRANVTRLTADHFLFFWSVYKRWTSSGQ
jgi:hypothetical protein